MSVDVYPAYDDRVAVKPNKHQVFASDHIIYLSICTNCAFNCYLTKNHMSEIESYLHKYAIKNYIVLCKKLDKREYLKENMQ